MKSLAALTLLAAAASAAIATPLLAAGVVAGGLLAVRAVEEIATWHDGKYPAAGPTEKVVATIQLRREKLVWVRAAKELR